MPESNHEPHSNRKRIGFADFLRAASVLYIVGYWHKSPFPTHERGSDLVVALTVIVLGMFVFCSGFLLGRTKTFDAPGSLWAFYKSRLLRVYPLFLVAALLFSYFKIASTTTLVRTALGIAMFYGPTPLALWFVAMIVVFYVVAPALIASLNDPRKYALRVLLIELTLVMLVLTLPTADSRIAMYFPAFASGIAWARFGRKWTGQQIGILCLLAVASVVITIHFAKYSPGSLFSLPMIAVVPLLIAYAAEHFLPDHPPFLIAQISYASFAAYLFHRPIIIFLRGLEGSHSNYLLYIILVFGLGWLAQFANDWLLSKAVRTRSLRELPDVKSR